MDASWEELERMAQAATAADAELATEATGRIPKETTDRWKLLFGYTYWEAVHLIEEQRSDVTRERITDDHWSLIKHEKEALGYDREAYEHSLQLPNVFKSQSASIPTAAVDGEMLFLFRLGGLLSTPQKVQEVAGLKELPAVMEGWSETGPVQFCAVDKDAQRKLEEWLTQQAVLQR